jgi:hypothetical protein
MLGLAAVCVVAGEGCHRRRARSGACIAHIDCDPGYDCRDGFCVKRPPVPGSEAARVRMPQPAAAVPAGAPAESPHREEAPAPTPKAPPPPAAPNYAPPLDPALPMWKARLKNS